MLCSSIRKQGEQERELEERESSLAVKLSKFWAFVGGGGGGIGHVSRPGLDSRPPLTQRPGQHEWRALTACRGSNPPD